MKEQPDTPRTLADALLEVTDLSVRFDTDEGRIHAVNGVSFSVRPRETLGLVGESGCGKSVTALSIMGLVPSPGRIAGGSIWFEGLDLTSFSEAKWRSVRGDAVSMIFQEPMTSLNPLHRVGDQIAEAVRIHRRMEPAKARAAAADLLGRVGIPEPKRRARSYPFQLSGGMRQRVMIAMALSCDPRLVIADEPTTALDVTIQSQILDLLARMRETFDTAVLLITHDLGVVAETADRVAVMYAGRIVEAADIYTLFDAPAHPDTRGLIASIPRMDQPVAENKRLATISGVVPALYALPTGCPFRDRCPEAFSPCGESEPPLFTVSNDHQARCWLHGDRTAAADR